MDESVAGIRVAPKVALTRLTAPGNSRSHKGFWQLEIRLIVAPVFTKFDLLMLKACLTGAVEERLIL